MKPIQQKLANWARQNKRIFLNQTMLISIESGSGCNLDLTSALDRITLEIFSQEQNKMIVIV
ncbi:hypothetical protein BLOT_001724 [Blomia tropicalis]|nr:hypothetical protein BLOT_001724 [Blomia tropicalis]